jgi:uncharacterized protein
MEALVRLVLRHPRLIVLSTAIVTLVAAWRASKLRLETDFAQLLPRSAPAVLALEELDRRMAALSSLDVVVEGPDAAANAAYVDALVPRLRALGDPLIDDVRAGVDEEQAFFEHNKLLYASAGDLERARTRLKDEIASHKNPLYVSLDDDDDGAAEEEAKAKSPFARFPNGHFAYADGSVYTALIWLRAPLIGRSTGATTVARIRQTAAALAAEHPSPGQHVGLTGNIITADEERAALTGDLTLATTVSTILVCAVVLWYFRRIGALVLMVLPALVGVVLALACAQWWFGALNTATGFLGAIILGNGINYAIVQMARYEEERRRGAGVPAATRVALLGTWRGTGLAALAAAVAYGSLALTDFRGFNQFGWIGGVGMILAWLATLLLMPALWLLCDRRGLFRAPPVGFPSFARLGRGVVANPRRLLVAGGALTLVALVPLVRFARDPFEYDFDKLRNQAAKRSEAERLSHRLDPIFGRSLSPGFVLADDAAQIDEIKQKLLLRDRGDKLLGSIRTVGDYLPGSAAEQTRKLALAADIRRLVDDNIDFIDDGDDRDRFKKLRPPDDLRILVPADLPRSVRRLFTETDGRIGRVAAWYPREDVDVWNGRVLHRIAAIVADLTLDDGTRVRSSGRVVVFAAIIDSVVHDGPLITAASFAAVLLLVLAVARRRGAWLIVGSLLVGAVWMMSAVAVAGVRINFLNFIALPITFGIATDYSANLYLRYRQEGVANLGDVIASTGGAVALCSLTTTIGYGALLLADTAGLRSFGAAAILGELACLTTALVLMPSVVVVTDRSEGPNGSDR